jgi:hypothetical protein
MFDIINGELVVSDIEENSISTDKILPNKSPKRDIWYIFNNICAEKNKLDWDDELEKLYSPFLINRMLVTSVNNTLMMCELNKHDGISKYHHYRMLHDLIQPKKKRFLKFFKESKYSDTIIKIADAYKMKYSEVDMYLQCISKENIDKIIDELDILTTKVIKKSKKTK